MRWAWVAAAVVSAGCTVPTYEETERAFGVGVDGRPSSDAWPLLVASCATELDELVGPGQGGRLVDGAKVKLVPDATEACPTPHAAACWWPDADLVYVDHDLAGLCHELKHRARDFLGLPLDYGHDDAAWWVVPP